jgi:hypothetical protein
MTIYQECDGNLLNVFRGDEGCADFPAMEIGDIIDYPDEHHCEGEPHTTLRRVE